MNILFVLSKKSWGGVNTQTAIVIDFLAANGHNVTLVQANRSLKLPIESDQVDQRRISFGFDFNPIVPLYFLSLLIGRKIDIVMANIEKDLMSVGPACKLLKIPLIRRIGREQDFNPISKKTRFIHQSFVTHGLCTSKAVANGSYARCDWLKTKIEVVYSGVVPKTFSSESIEAQKTALGITKNDMVLGITARLSEEKRIDFLINTLAPLLTERGNIKLVIAGTGELEESLKTLAHTLGVSDKIIFAGFTNEPILFASLYDICYLPSAFDSFPFTIIEYMAAGRPTIASNVCGIPEGITDGENGFLIEPDDAERLLK